MDPLNTHTYDGDIDKTQIPELALVKDVDVLEKKSRANELYSLLSNDVSKNFLKNIIDDLGQKE